MDFHLHKLYDELQPANLIDENFFSIHDIMLAAHEGWLKKILRNLLNREPVPEDAKRLTRVYRANKDNVYLLAFDNVIIGKVETVETKVDAPEWRYEWRMIFTPVKEDTTIHAL